MSEKNKRQPDLYCGVNGKLLAREEAIFLTSSPENILTIDINRQLPGRHFCLECKREVLELAVRQGKLQEFFGNDLNIPTDFCEKTNVFLRKKVVELLCLARKSGFLIFGFDKVTQASKTGKSDFILRALDTKSSSTHSADINAKAIKVFAVLTSGELGKIIGRKRVVHIAMLKGNVNMSKSILEMITRVKNF